MLTTKLKSTLRLQNYTSMNQSIRYFGNKMAALQYPNHVNPFVTVMTVERISIPCESLLHEKSISTK